MLIGAASLSARPPAFSIILANTTNQKSWLASARNQDKRNLDGWTIRAAIKKRRTSFAKYQHHLGTKTASPFSHSSWTSDHHGGLLSKQWALSPPPRPVAAPRVPSRATPAKQF
jgi:hypothetical protein